MSFYTGIDVGSCTTKAVVIDGEGKIIGDYICRSGVDYEKAAREAINNK